MRKSTQKLHVKVLQSCIQGGLVIWLALSSSRRRWMASMRISKPCPFLACNQWLQWPRDPRVACPCFVHFVPSLSTHTQMHLQSTEYSLTNCPCCRCQGRSHSCSSCGDGDSGDGDSGDGDLMHPEHIQTIHLLVLLGNPSEVSMNTLLLNGALPDQSGGGFADAATSFLDVLSESGETWETLPWPDLVNSLMDEHWFFYGLILPLGSAGTNPTNLNSLILMTPQRWFIGIVSATSGRTCYWPHWRLLGLHERTCGQQWTLVVWMQTMRKMGGTVLLRSRLWTCSSVSYVKWSASFHMWRAELNGEVAKWKERKSTSTCRKWNSMSNMRECTQLPRRWKKKLSRPLVCTFFFASDLILGCWDLLRLPCIEHGPTKPIT